MFLLIQKDRNRKVFLSFCENCSDNTCVFAIQLLSLQRKKSR
ncbi:hypothetical protein HMPREF3034_02459 [Prevotella sp. DNF00663]|nr:hypothetical protein HMPREF3034_02459 [Prevotella sp. DNF00663]